MNSGYTNYNNYGTCTACSLKKMGCAYLTPCCYQVPGYEQTIHLCDICASACTTQNVKIRCPHCTFEVIIIRHNKDKSIKLNRALLCEGPVCKANRKRVWTDQLSTTPCCHEIMPFCDNCSTNDIIMPCPYCFAPIEITIKYYVS